jgi:hypothetical protein
MYRMSIDAYDATVEQPVCAGVYDISAPTITLVETNAANVIRMYAYPTPTEAEVGHMLERLIYGGEAIRVGFVDLYLAGR